MDLMGARIRLDPRPTRRRRSALEVAMLGHAPGDAARGEVRVDRLLQRRDALEEMRRVGFGQAVDALRADSAPAEGIGGLHQLPIPLHSAAEFDDLFPKARDGQTRYVSVLAGARAWLPQAVQDYFANGGEKLWVIRVPESQGQAGFLPRLEGTVLHDVGTLQGIALVMVLLDVGVMALPDLERLQIPARLPDIERLRLANPPPAFLPCGTEVDDTHRERRRASEMEGAPEPLSTAVLLEQIQGDLRRHRPDLQCLFTLPLSYGTRIGAPVADPAALQAIEHMKSTRSGPGLRRVQFLFPYLRGFDHRLVSSVGLVAGLQARVAGGFGSWRSVAGLPMLTAGRPYPQVDTHVAVGLRESPGIGVLRVRNGVVHLDDERLSVPALHRGDWAQARNPDRYKGYRSGEVQRFLGSLVRQLQSLGDALVFNLGSGDPRPRLLLERLFGRLFQAGALRGNVPEDAFSIRESRPQEGALVFEIEVAPAFPIDRVQLTFANRSGEWRAEVKNA